MAGGGVLIRERRKNSDRSHVIGQTQLPGRDRWEAAFMSIFTHVCETTVRFLAAAALCNARRANYHQTTSNINSTRCFSGCFSRHGEARMNALSVCVEARSVQSEAASFHPTKTSLPYWWLAEGIGKYQCSHHRQRWRWSWCGWKFKGKTEQRDNRSGPSLKPRGRDGLSPLCPAHQNVCSVFYNHLLGGGGTNPLLWAHSQEATSASLSQRERYSDRLSPDNGSVRGNRTEDWRLVLFFWTEWGARERLSPTLCLSNKDVRHAKPLSWWRPSLFQGSN